MSDDIEDGIERYYRQMIAEEIISCMHGKYEDDKLDQQVYWFNQGISFASMVARWGVGNDRG